MTKHKRILLAHGSGGKLTHQLIDRLFVPTFHNQILERLDDGAILLQDFDTEGNKRSGMAFTTDSYVVDPIFFPGGDIGRLAVCGTVNDLAMCGAEPLYLSAGLILEEGFPFADLETIVESMQQAAEEAGVSIVTGDTKVVRRGNVDKLFINTAGIGRVFSGVQISGRNAQVGDRVILSGTLGEHGLAVLLQREGLAFQSKIRSDVAPVNKMVSRMLQKFPDAIHVLRDPTRGGLATTLNEIAQSSQVAIELEEVKIPVSPEVLSACELLGFDPLYVANEGKFIAIVAPEVAEPILQFLRRFDLGENAAIIGQVLERPQGKVLLNTSMGGTRLVDMLVGEQLPRIC